MSGDSVLKTIPMQPGIQKNITKLAAEGGWVDSNLIRWRNGRPEKLGGWVKETTVQATQFGFSSAFSNAFEGDNFNSQQQFKGVPRHSHGWTALDGSKFMSVATTEKVQLLNQNLIYDITPFSLVATLNNIISGTTGSALITVAIAGHGAQAGGFINFNPQSAPVGNINLDGDYQVSSVIDGNRLVIDARVNANSTFTNAGGTFIVSVYLSAGPVSNGDNTGWGGGTWGQGTWGTPRAGVGGLNLRQWSQDNWGEDLVACVREGGIYYWDRTNGVSTHLQKITEAPRTNLFVMIAQPSRILVAFGSETFATGIFDPLIIRWAAEETTNHWNIDDTTNAGEFRLPRGNTITGAVQTRDEILVFTDVDVYSMRFVGGLDVFDFKPLGTHTASFSQRSSVDVEGVVYGISTNNFFYYDGALHTLPCTLQKYIFDPDGEGRINLSQKEKLYSGVNKEYNEIFWFYPRYDYTECSHYIKYNYLENLWDFGQLSRTTWLDKGVFNKPYATTADGTLYVHEQGDDDDSQPMDSFITTAYFDIGDGQDLMFVDRIVPDLFLAANRDLQISVFVKRFPHPNSDVITKGPFFFNDNDTQINLRARGRQVALEFRSFTNGGFFEIGVIKVGFQSDGARG